jgi:hypothetical protein
MYVDRHIQEANETQGAHLVMCHMCAPVFVLRSAPAQTEPTVQEPVKQSWQETVRRASASLERSPELRRRMIGLMPPSEQVEDDACEDEDRSPQPGQGLGRSLRRASASHPHPQHRASDEHARNGEIATGELATRFQSMQVGSQVILTSKGDAQAQCVVCRAGVVGWLRVYGA